MKVATFLVLGSAAVSQLVAAHSGSATAALRKHRRDLLKTLYARQDYGGGFTQPTCQTDSIDTRNADGSCNCGPGREQSGPNNCVTSTAAASNYNPVPAPQTPDFRVSNSKRYTGPADFMDTNQCAAIATDFPTSRGFYIQPSVIDSGNNDCWVLGDQNSDSPPFQASPFDNMPFVSNGGTGSTKRAVPGATTGTVGNGTGTIGYPAAVSGAGTCDTGLGDSVNGDSTCTCGPGRVNDTPQTCVTSASAAARLRRRAVDQNASW